MKSNIGISQDAYENFSLDSTFKRKNNEDLNTRATELTKTAFTSHLNPKLEALYDELRVYLIGALTRKKETFYATLRICVLVPAH